MTGSAKKIVSWLIKAVIIILAFTFIYRRLSNNQELRQFKELIDSISTGKVVTIITLVVVLMLVNWLLEAMKWRYLTRDWAPITLWQSIESVFCGLTLAIFTPNRLGDYGGRVMFLPSRKRLYGVFAMAVGSIGQMVVTNVLGAASLLWFVCYFLHINHWLYIGLLTSGVGFIVLMLVFYFNIGWLVSLLNAVPFLRKYHRFFDVMKRYRFAELVHIMGYCLARFATFSLQYYLIIHLLLPEVPMVKMMLLVFVFFFIQSLLPTIDVVDIGVRSATADKLFEYVTHQHIVVIAAVALIWLTNLIIPAILGSVFVLKLKFFDNNI